MPKIKGGQELSVSRSYGWPRVIDVKGLWMPKRNLPTVFSVAD